MLSSGSLTLRIFVVCQCQFIIFFMNPAPSGKPFPESPHKWEEFWGTMIALLTLTLPVAAIATYSSTVQPAAITVPAAQK